MTKNMPEFLRAALGRERIGLDYCEMDLYNANNAGAVSSDRGGAAVAPIDKPQWFAFGDGPSMTAEGRGVMERTAAASVDPGAS